MELELRNEPGRVELRSGGSGIGTLTGYASVFGKRSENLGGFVEVVDSKAFTKTLKDGGPVVARLNHNDDFLLGTTEGGTLRLSVDRRGLRYDVDLPDTQAGRDVKVLAERGDLRYSSFAFRTVSDAWTETDDGYPLRTLTAVQLVDVAPVVSPAYRDTSTEMSPLRSLAGHLGMDLAEVRAAAAAGDLRRLFHHPPAPAKSPEVRQDLELLRRKLALWAD
ncbi:HK97 family phage prohead protease [Arthrobacter sp. B10-11]|uniref:HK97 family phage prohead protease n=1 Tax=Arthrobacter sp. B10-11 TaxID=3081160 RepID=UPI002953C25A|nr:HK97 family phage prohead protease [Arthrobacter sp. B10-11]MDV8146259.1 HK97 family phage prohead protease [Arthrobacter sp. B10-11]